MITKDTAREIDEIKAELGPLLRARTNLPAAMALALLAAHHVIHDGGDEEDFMRVAKAAWWRSRQIHDETCSHSS